MLIADEKPTDAMVIPGSLPKLSGKGMPSKKCIRDQSSVGNRNWYASLRQSGRKNSRGIGIAPSSDHPISGTRARMFA
jgi:hypothetical protein